ncbi:MAG TPA: hypothetical protein VFU21_28955 [Kofleriaceae bacterium]|nr:hypothetical protein [Kofleriaceae bacterium]
MRRFLLAVFLVLAAAPPLARADDGAIAVLPLTSSEKRLAMYGVPVARVLAGQLRQAGNEVETVTSSGSLPRRVAWVIDGRIVAASRGRVVLEARLRDPARGRAIGQVASKPGRLTDIDELARQVAAELAPLLARARAESASARSAPPPDPTTSPAPAPAVRPAIVVTRDKEPIVTDALAALVERLGYRPVVSDLKGIAPPEKVKGALGDARFALLAEVKSVDYEWAGKDVMTARGSMRLVLVDGAGKPLYNAVLETDTLVGSRGDRHAALLGFVARQVMQMAAPRLKKVLAR